MAKALSVLTIFLCIHNTYDKLDVTRFSNFKINGYRKNIPNVVYRYCDIDMIEISEISDKETKRHSMHRVSCLIRPTIHGNHRGELDVVFTARYDSPVCVNIVNVCTSYQCWLINIMCITLYFILIFKLCTSTIRVIT